MPNTRPINAKIYDRPERARPTLLLFAILVLALVIGGFFVYRAFHQNTAAPSPHSDSRTVWPQMAYRYATSVDSV